MAARIILATLFLLPVQVGAGDWPMWRGDAERSGATPDELPQELSPQWSRQLESPRPAWPESQVKLQFDAVIQPVAANGRLFVASSANDSLTAYDIATGEQLWRHYGDGPFRLPPAVSGSRVLAVCDDGTLTCLNSADGGLLWQVDGAPNQRPIIGNGRLISTWPARGGVVVADGVAYFAAGIWPSLGIFVRAVDIESGEVLWTNGETGQRYVTHPHGADAFGSLSPQGALVVSGDKLLVPGGRTLPAVFDRATGRMEHFEFGGKGSGGHEVVVGGPYHTVRDELFRTSDGLALGRVPGSLVLGDHFLGTDLIGALVRTSIAAEEKVEEVTDRRGRVSTRTTLIHDSVDRYALTQRGTPALAAGHTVFVISENTIAAYDLDSMVPDASNEPVWTTTLDDDVASLIAASDRLIATTHDARIVCFGAESKPLVHYELTLERPEVDDSARQLAEEVLGHAQFSGGYAVALNGDDAGLLAAIIDASGYNLLVLDEDESDVSLLRTVFDAAGIYGERISGHVANVEDYRLPPYLADLIFDTVARDYTANELASIFSALRPYGGVACLRTTPDQHAAIVAGADELDGAVIQRVDDWSLISRPGALPGSGQWTHQYADATNSSISAEQLVQAPLGVLWFGGPANDKVLPRHGHGPSPQVAGGRLFIEGPDMLRCVDVYTGRVWWEREFPGLGEYYDETGHQPGAGEIGSNYVSTPEQVYVVYGEKLLALDARTGETIREWTTPSGGGHWGAAWVDGDVLLAAAEPLDVQGGTSSKEAVVPDGWRALVAPHADWRYLAGTDPEADWVAQEFDDANWPTGKAGFGYGDSDDKTELNDMPGKYTRVYIRRTFQQADVDDIARLSLVINYDDAFIAYLNGEEIVRDGVGSGRGPNAGRLSSHEADGFQTFDISAHRDKLRPGENVLCIEGHNDGAGSSDFSLDPFLIAAGPQSEGNRPQVADLLTAQRFSAASGRLVAYERFTGELLWQRDAETSFRHNCVCIGGETVFCLDGLSEAKRDALRRRGAAITPSQLLALDLANGDVRWSTTEDLFGTFLNYSREHDVLLQGGSAFRDRAEDESGRGLVAYRGADGEVLWRDLELAYSGPCLLHGESIITNGNGGFELDLLTAEPTGWNYQRMYGCNTAIGCQTLFTFRSGAAGYFDLQSDSGTGNLGGFRSSCTSNLIPADGVLSAPDYTRTCVCAYQLQTSLAFVHMPEAESWTFNAPTLFAEPEPQAVGINLGAPGDRRDSEGTLWLEYPVVGGPSPKLDLSVNPESVEWFSTHTALLRAEPEGWITASGGTDIRRVEWDTSDAIADGVYDVRVLFARRPDINVASSCTVRLQDGAYEADRDSNVQAVVFPGVSIDGKLVIEITSESAEIPPLAGFAVIPAAASGDGE